MAWWLPRRDEKVRRPAGPGRRHDVDALRVRNEFGAGPEGPGIAAVSTKLGFGSRQVLPAGRHCSRNHAHFRRRQGSDPSRGGR
jgi:hypothetical protein